MAFSFVFIYVQMRLPMLLLTGSLASVGLRFAVLCGLILFCLCNVFLYFSYRHIFYGEYLVDVANTAFYRLSDVYLFPYIYIFLAVTGISIIYCLAYNRGEVVMFMFYCLIIFMGGFVFFITNSILIFFFSYEMLLMPSFFLLYRFAKTRRCVEAAYLMFF